MIITIMKKHFLIIILTSVFYINSFSQNDDKANVLAVERSMAAAYGKHDVVTLNNVYADDVSIIATSGNMINKQQLFKMVQTSNGVTLSDMSVKVGGNVAVVTGISVITGVDNGPYSNKLRFTDVFERVNNQWKITSSQQTSVAQ